MRKNRAYKILKKEVVIGKKGVDGTISALTVRKHGLVRADGNEKTAENNIK